MAQGRGSKLVTEDSKPVGSGRFRDQTWDAEAVPGLSLSLLIQDLPPSVSLLCREHPLLQVSLLHFLGSSAFPVLSSCKL